MKYDNDSLEFSINEINICEFDNFLIDKVSINFELDISQDNEYNYDKNPYLHGKAKKKEKINRSSSKPRLTRKEEKPIIKWNEMIENKPEKLNIFNLINNNSHVSREKSPLKKRKRFNTSRKVLNKNFSEINIIENKDELLTPSKSFKNNDESNLNELSFTKNKKQILRSLATMKNEKIEKTHERKMSPSGKKIMKTSKSIRILFNKLAENDEIQDNHEVQLVSKFHHNVLTKIKNQAFREMETKLDQIVDREGNIKNRKKYQTEKNLNKIFSGRNKEVNKRTDGRNINNQEGGKFEKSKKFDTVKFNVDKLNEIFGNINENRNLVLDKSRTNKNSQNNSFLSNQDPAQNSFIGNKNILSDSKLINKNLSLFSKDKINKENLENIDFLNKEYSSVMILAPDSDKINENIQKNNSEKLFDVIKNKEIAKEVLNNDKENNSENISNKVPNNENNYIDLTEKNPIIDNLEVKNKIVIQKLKALEIESLNNVYFNKNNGKLKEKNNQIESSETVFSIIQKNNMPVKSFLEIISQNIKEKIQGFKEILNNNSIRKFSEEFNKLNQNKLKIQQKNQLTFLSQHKGKKLNFDFENQNSISITGLKPLKFGNDLSSNLIQIEFANTHQNSTLQEKTENFNEKDKYLKSVTPTIYYPRKVENISLKKNNFSRNFSFLKLNESKSKKDFLTNDRFPYKNPIELSKNLNFSISQNENLNFGNANDYRSKNSVLTNYQIQITDNNLQSRQSQYKITDSYSNRFFRTFGGLSETNSDRFEYKIIRFVKKPQIQFEIQPSAAKEINSSQIIVDKNEKQNQKDSNHNINQNKKVSEISLTRGSTELEERKKQRENKKIIIFDKEKKPQISNNGNNNDISEQGIHEEDLKITYKTNNYDYTNFEKLKNLTSRNKESIFSKNDAYLRKTDFEDEELNTYNSETNELEKNKFCENPAVFNTSSNLASHKKLKKIKVKELLNVSKNTINHNINEKILTSYNNTSKDKNLNGNSNLRFIKAKQGEVKKIFLETKKFLEKKESKAIESATTAENIQSYQKKISQKIPIDKKALSNKASALLTNKYSVNSEETSSNNEILFTRNNECIKKKK